MTVIDCTSFIEPTIRVRVGEHSYRLAPLTLEKSLERDSLVEELKRIEADDENAADKARMMRDCIVDLILLYVPDFDKETLADISVPSAMMVFRAIETQLAAAWEKTFKSGEASGGGSKKK